MEELSPALQLCQQLQALLEWEQAHPMGEEEEEEQELSPALRTAGPITIPPAARAEERDCRLAC